MNDTQDKDPMSAVPLSRCIHRCPQQLKKKKKEGKDNSDRKGRRMMKD